MQIEYELTEKDYMEFQIYHIAHARINRGFRIFQSMMFPMFFLIVLALNWGTFFQRPMTSANWFSLIVFIILLGIFYLLKKNMMQNAMKKIVKRLVKENPYLLSRHSAEVTDGGLTIKNASQEIKIGWDGIDRVEENDAFIFIYTDERAAQIIPKRAFTDKGQEEAFISLLRGKTCREVVV